MNLKINIIASGSTGNACLYGSVLVDCGIPYKKLKEHLEDVDVILISHRHGDHFNKKCVELVMKNYPRIPFFAYDPILIDELTNIANIVQKNNKIYPLKIGKQYDLENNRTIVPIKLYHDVPNTGFRINLDGYKIFHATDTAHLNGINPGKCDLYAIECNHTEALYDDLLNDFKENEDYLTEEEFKGYNTKLWLFSRSMNSHLSEEQCHNYFKKWKIDEKKWIKLHCSKERLRK